LKFCIVEIATGARPGCEADLVDPIAPPVHWRDPLKIAAFKDERRRESVDRAAQDPDLCEVDALALLDGEGTAIHTRADVDEVELLGLFWDYVDGYAPVIVGYDCLRFTLPVLQRRALYLDVPMPAFIVDRFRADRVVDLAERLSYHRMLPWRSLAFYCRRFGIPYAPPITAAFVPQAVADGNWTLVTDKLQADLDATVALARRIGVIPAAMPSSRQHESAL
jgi:Predicted 3'-5' exonuclease related to the exonuclease domain of PolB